MYEEVTMMSFGIQHPRRILVAALLCSALLLSGCATTGINKGQINLIGTEEEVQMGKELSTEVEKEYTIYRNAEVSAYVQSVGNKVVRVCDRKDIEYHFAVIEKDELNAFAMPGGYVYVYTGLMKDLDDEAQLAAVLAHEVGHVTARHSTERLTAIYGYQVLASLLLGDDPNFWAGLVANIFSTSGMLAYSRQNEYEADKLGLTYANAAGYDPGGMVELLTKFIDTERGEPSKLEEWLSTHPPSTERMNRVKTMVAGLQVEGELRNAAAYAKIKGMLP
jgi:predicted Zn-dependent protease